MTDEIKNCPFCGGEAEIIQEAAYKAAHCKNRDCELFYTHIPLGISLIGKDWQSRPLEDKLTAENAKLRELVGELVGHATFLYQCRGSRLENEVRYESLMSKHPSLVLNPFFCKHYTHSLSPLTLS